MPRLAPIEINFRQMLINSLAKSLVTHAGIATKADIPAAVRATPDVVIKGETSMGDRLNIYSRFSETQFISLAMQNPWSFSNARILGQIVADGDLRIQQRSAESSEKWDEVISHPFEEIIEARPNPYMSQYYVWLYQVLWFLMKGEAYWMVVKNDLGEPIELYPLPASRVLPIPGKDEMFEGFAYSPIIGEPPKLLLPEDICYHRFPNIFQYFRGWSTLNAYLSGLKTDKEASDFDLRDYENGLELKQIISLRTELDDTEFLTALQDLIDAQEDGLRFMAIRGGDMDIKNITQRRADSSGNIREKMASIAGRVFAVFDGFWDKSANRASSERAEQNTISYGAWPIMRMFAEDITAQIVIPAYGSDFRVNFVDIRPRNIELDIAEENHNWSAMTWDQVQETKGREPHPDPDVGTAPFSAAPKIAVVKVARRDTTTIQGGQETRSQPNNSIIESKSEVNVDSSFFHLLDQADLNGKTRASIVLPQSESDLLRRTLLRNVDLKKWRTVALRLIGKGKRPERYEFHSENISPKMIKGITRLLEDCKTVKDVRSVFVKQEGKPFIPLGSNGYEPDDEVTVAEIAELAEIESEEFADEFDVAVPELGTILESEELNISSEEEQ